MTIDDGWIEERRWRVEAVPETTVCHNEPAVAQESSGVIFANQRLVPSTPPRSHVGPVSVTLDLYPHRLE